MGFLSWWFVPIAAFFAAHGSIVVTLSPGVILKTRVLGSDQIELDISVNKNTWIGVGLPSGQDISMTGNGAGTDAVVCSEGAASRYWLTSYEVTGGVIVTNATCEHGPSSSRLTFVRKLKADTSTQRSITIGSVQPITYAHGTDGTTRLAYHKTRGGAKLDLGAPIMTATTTTTTTPTVVKTPGADTVQLMPGLQLTAKKLSPSSIQITVTSQQEIWVALGFSSGSVSMTGNGGGVDAFICSDGVVKRYWMTTRSKPSDGREVAGATCSLVSGGSTMVFTRDLAAATSEERAVTLGKKQAIIHAHGHSVELAYHKARGGLLVDFATLSVAEAGRRPGETTLYLHLVFMGLSWGMLLPWGAAMANRLRKPPPGASPASWFLLHRVSQSCGLLLALLGFAAAIAHVNGRQSPHFTSPHHMLGAVVTALGVLQAGTAASRNLCAHPKVGEAKTLGRRVFEISHRAGGWLAVVLGIFQLVTGIALANSLGYDFGVIVTASVLVVLGVGSVASFSVLASLKRDNAWSRMLTGMVTTQSDPIPSQNDKMAEPNTIGNTPGS